MLMDAEVGRNAPSSQDRTKQGLIRDIGFFKGQTVYMDQFILKQQHLLAPNLEPYQLGPKSHANIADHIA